MPLSAGEKLGSYEILSPLGAGGMGEVYRARDNKLGREVAIKVLPEEFTQHPQKLARFEREARLLASLNHPGIATLHGLEKSKGKPFLVMELVEGETLADRISQGPIPATEALTLCQQIAEALEAAHEKGVIHRDLKPANIKVDPEGHVKVLDFGLAKAFADEVPESELSQSPTLSRDATRAGVILGTAAYMSPEQAKGKTVDKRSDIFSFGAVLYEMLTGKRAFAGEDVSDVLASIIKLDVDWKALPSDLDPRIEKLLGRCLKPDRKKRLRDVGDVRNELDEILTEPAASIPTQSLAVSEQSRAREWIVRGLSILAAVLLTSLAFWGLTEESAPAVSRFVIPPPADVPLGGAGRGNFLALSLDGRHLVYIAGGQLYLRAMEQLSAMPLPGTNSPYHPFFSPDGRWVGFFAGGELKKVLHSGGNPLTVAEVPENSYRGATWMPDDTIIFGQLNGGLMSVAASEGTPETLTTVDTESGERAHRWPEMLPGAKALLFTVIRESLEESRIAVLSLDTGERQILLEEEGYNARYVPTGHLVYIRAGTLMAVPFDLKRLEVTGTPVPVVDGIQVRSAGAADFAVAQDGTLVYIPGGSSTELSFVWVDREGREEPVPAQPRAYQEFTLSPDGMRLAVRIAGDNADVWIYDLERDTQTRLTFDPATEAYPVWSPDGERVAFGGAGLPLSWKSADGTGEVESLLEDSSDLIPNAFSSDGTALVFDDVREGGDLSMLSLEAERASTLLLDTDFAEHNAALSPNGRWMGYQSNESGQYEIYVRPFPDVDTGKWQLSSDGGVWPVWAPDGRWLFYVGPQAVTAVEVETERTLMVGRREQLFDITPYFANISMLYRRMAIAPDGRFLMLKRGASEDTGATPGIVVVQNWYEELKRLVPTN